MPRGGSSVIYELDGNLTFWRDGDITTLYWLGKIRDIPFDPIQFEHALVQPEGMVDALGRQMPGPVLRPDHAREGEGDHQGDQEPQDSHSRVCPGAPTGDPSGDRHPRRGQPRNHTEPCRT